jgi:hypothetical protein
MLLVDATRYEALLATGVLEDAEEYGGLPYAYYSHAEEIPDLLAATGFEPARLLATDGIISGIEDRVNTLRGADWDAWADLNYDLAEDPGLLATSMYLLAVAHRRGPGPR